MNKRGGAVSAREKDIIFLEFFGSLREFLYEKKKSINGIIEIAPDIAREKILKYSILRILSFFALAS